MRTHQQQREVWEELAHDLEGDFIEGGLYWGDEIVVEMEDWIAILSYRQPGRGRLSLARGPLFTHMTASFTNNDEFRFWVRRQGLSRPIETSFGWFLGMQETTAGDPEFDRDFTVSSNDELKVRTLFANPTIRQLIRSEPYVDLQAKKGQLCWTEAGSLEDVEKIESLFKLFAELLQELRRLDSEDRATLVCPNCGAPYNPDDYRPDAEHIYCSKCQGEVERDPQPA